jgi:Tol biopolymer transport system component
VALSAGTRLGPYEILAPLGAGGMGEVYRARDSRLDRDVAIKVLPERVATDTAARERFEREAKAVAALSHPNILSIFEFGSHDGVAYAVTELLEGETLRLALTRGRLASRRALEYAQQMAQGLAAAHDKGIVHRDLKPENLFVTADGRIKILDFGLARQDASRAHDDSVSPTLSKYTDPGTILGTVGYMSPEQARGAVADHRSDIFSFGSVLYEMLTGERAFQRDTAAETLTAILREEPKELSSLTGSLPPALERILRHCLEKDPAARVQSARDLAFDLELIAGLTTSGVEKLATRGGVLGRARGRALWLGAGVLAGVVAAVAMLRLAATPSGPHGPMHVSVNLPKDSRLGGWLFELVAISPDGQRLVYSAAGADGTLQLYLRGLNQPQGSAIPGTEGGSMPFFSPDGQWLGFSVLGASKLRRVSVDGGAPRDLADAPYPGGASWSEDGAIVYAPNISRGSPLMRVSSEGGKPQSVTTLAKGEVNHLWPQLLPGGDAVLFTVERAGKSFDDAHIVLQDLKTGERQVVVEGGTHGGYLASGHVVYARGNALYAVPFDLRRRRATGPSQRLVEGVRVEAPTGCAQFATSTSGTLVYLPGGGPAAERALVWVDRSGNATRVTDAGRLYVWARLSPDGRKVVTAIAAADDDLWLVDIATGAHTRLTFEGENGNPLWSPDGRSIIFASSRDGANNLYRTPADGSHAAERLTDSPNEHGPTAVSRDGRVLVFTESKPDGDTDLAVLSLMGKPEVRPLIHTAFQESDASISPDGRYVAYASNESGRNEVYVQPFPGLESKTRVSVDGGDFPIWSRDGREIYFRNGDKALAVSVSPGGPFSVSRPKQLFEGNFSPSWEVAPDGRFLMVRRSEEQTSSRQINVVLNWFEELKQRVPGAAR